MKAFLISFPIAQIQRLVGYYQNMESAENMVEYTIASHVVSSWNAFIRTEEAFREGFVPREVLVTQHRHMARLLRMDEVAELRLAIGLPGLSPVERSNCEELLTAVLAQRAAAGAAKASERQQAAAKAAEEVNHQGGANAGANSTAQPDVPAVESPTPIAGLFTAAETPQVISEDVLSGLAARAVDLFKGVK